MPRPTAKCTWHSRMREKELRCGLSVCLPLPLLTIISLPPDGDGPANSGVRRHVSPTTTDTSASQPSHSLQLQSHPSACSSRGEYNALLVLSSSLRRSALGVDVSCNAGGVLWRARRAASRRHPANPHVLRSPNVTSLSCFIDPLLGFVNRQKCHWI